MNKPDNQADMNTAPMSEGADVTQTMLMAGMLQPPARPGARGAVGRFEILRPLAAGGMGQVFLAREPVTEGRVAIKMIRPRFLRDENVVRRFLTEAQHMYRMSHPNILKVMEVCDRKDGPYYVMPFIEKGSLAQAIKPGQPLPEDRILTIARQVAESLKYAHARGIIHRDLKPANILLDAEDHAYLTDFGLLRTVFNDDLIDPDKSGPEGTAAYMSPLAASGKAEDTRCDIYSFGALLYEMLTGVKPYEGQNPRAIVEKILTGPPRPVREINKGASASLARIAEWCMARELRDRYAEMKDVVRDLDGVIRKEEPLGPHGASEGQAVMVLKLSGKRSVGKILAVAGTFLQGLCAASLLWTVIQLAVGHLGAEPQQPVSLARGLAHATAPFAAGFLLGGVAGWFMLILALGGCRYRAPWFYRALHIIAVPWLLVFPVGTLVSVLVLIHLRQHRLEFATEPPPAKPTLFLYVESAAVLLIALLTVGLFGYLAYNMLRRQAGSPPRRISLVRPASSDAGDLCTRAWRVWREQKYEEAEKLFLKATQADPRWADAWNGLGWARQNMGMTQNAKEAFERCVALDPKNAGALNGLGWIAKIERRQHEATRYWEQAIAADPHATAALAGLASTHLELGYYDLAVKHARNWLDLEPGNAEAKRILDEARTRLEETKKLAPEEKRGEDASRDPNVTAIWRRWHKQEFEQIHGPRLEHPKVAVETKEALEEATWNFFSRRGEEYRRQRVPGTTAEQKARIEQTIRNLKKERDDTIRRLLQPGSAKLFIMYEDGVAYRNILRAFKAAQEEKGRPLPPPAEWNLMKLMWTTSDGLYQLSGKSGRDHEPLTSPRWREDFLSSAKSYVEEQDYARLAGAVDKMPVVTEARDEVDAAHGFILRNLKTDLADIRREFAAQKETALRDLMTALDKEQPLPETLSDEAAEQHWKKWQAAFLEQAAGILDPEEHALLKKQLEQFENIGWAAERLATGTEARKGGALLQAPERQVTVQFREAPLRIAAMFYAEMTGKSVILSPQVDANRLCTLQSNGRIPVSEAAQLIEAYLSAAGLKFTTVGQNSLRIDPAGPENVSSPSPATERSINVLFTDVPIAMVADFYSNLVGKPVNLVLGASAGNPRCTLNSNGNVSKNDAAQLIEDGLRAIGFQIVSDGPSALRIEPLPRRPYSALTREGPSSNPRPYRLTIRNGDLGALAGYYKHLTGKNVTLSPGVSLDQRLTLDAGDSESLAQTLTIIDYTLAAIGLKITPVDENTVRIDPRAPAVVPVAAEPPRIVGTKPDLGAAEVDPAATEITVTFDQDMAGGFSWTGGGPDYPEITGHPFWRDARTCVLPVKLEAGRYYRVGINSKSHRNFRSRAGVPTPPSAIYFTTQGAGDELKARTQKPVVLEISPANGATDVDPTTAELRVTFSMPMGGGFSWTGGGPEYPEGIEGQGPYWTEDQRTCVLPVSLKPGQEYRLGLNSFSHKNFQSAAGVPLEPVDYRFQTRP